MQAWCIAVLERVKANPTFMALVFKSQEDFIERLTRGTGGYWLQVGDKYSTSAAFLQQGSEEQLAAWEPLFSGWNSCGREKNVLSVSPCFVNKEHNLGD